MQTCMIRPSCVTIKMVPFFSLATKSKLDYHCTWFFDSYNDHLWWNLFISIYKFLGILNCLIHSIIQENITFQNIIKVITFV